MATDVIYRVGVAPNHRLWAMGVPPLASGALHASGFPDLQALLAAFAGDLIRSGWAEQRGTRRGYFRGEPVAFGNETERHALAEARLLWNGEPAVLAK